MNFQLEVGAASSAITVSETVPLLEAETSSLGQVYEEKMSSTSRSTGATSSNLLRSGRARCLPRARRNAITSSRTERGLSKTATCWTASTIRTGSSDLTRGRRRSSHR